MNLARFFLGLFFLMLFLGCSRNPYNIPVQYVEGTVTVDNAPMKGINVTFVPKDGDGELASGVTDENGKYRLTSANGPSQKGALVGEYSVTLRKIESSKGEGVPTNADGMPDPTQMRPGGRVMVVVKQLLPTVYGGVETTPFSVKVENKRKNQFDFELDSNIQ